ncbi:Mediator of RNA polymerase II transcription subunit 13 [Ceratocystis platani]|uniref:Mediator of RNA polymerase II transcription subunit 13 n=2 Tax=Ceratocystis TaxID=5157 RepID=A0A0F8D415_CERFI|nr:Mediator of RNA polymerase II transcription subunit 13 [Ceratocystis platani]
MPAPSILLDEPVQRSSIEFKTSAPSESILHENSSIHVAYAKSLDNRWISIAWTDSRGLQQQTASYCLIRKGVRGQGMQWNDIAQDIWQATIELMAVWKVCWRVVISKCGAMDPSEVEYWTQLAQNETRASFYLVLLAVDTAPALQLLPKAVQLSASVQSATYATPAGTPQASTPEVASTPRATADGPSTTPTPSTVDVTSDPDGDGVLIDVAEQTWGIVLSHRLNNSMMPARQNLAMASGYLVKRGGMRCEDPPAVLEVNLVWLDGVARGVDPMLREMLKQFRGLGTLARARGVTEQWDVRPWHIAAAEKGVRTLYALL